MTQPKTSVRPLQAPARPATPRPAHTVGRPQSAAVPAHGPGGRGLHTVGGHAARAPSCARLARRRQPFRKHQKCCVTVLRPEFPPRQRVTPLTSSGIWPLYPPDAKKAHCARCEQRTAVLPPPRSGAHRRKHTVWDTRRHQATDSALGFAAPLYRPASTKQQAYHSVFATATLSKVVRGRDNQPHAHSPSIEAARPCPGSLPVFRRLSVLGCGRAFSHPGGDRRSKQGSSGRLLGMRPVSSAVECLAVKHANTRREQGTRSSSACGERERDRSSVSGCVPWYTGLWVRDSPLYSGLLPDVPTVVYASAPKTANERPHRGR